MRLRWARKIKKKLEGLSSYQKFRFNLSISSGVLATTRAIDTKLKMNIRLKSLTN